MGPTEVDLHPDSSDSLRLMQLAAAGSQSAFERLCERYRGHLKRYVELRMDHRLQQRVDPSDVIQETQLELFNRLEDYLQRRPLPIRVWLRRTAREQLLNLYHKHVKAEQRSLNRELPLSDLSAMAIASRFASGEDSPSAGAIRNERRESVAQSVSSLPASDREILLMRSVEGLHYQEIAAALEISPAAARKRYGRALLKLQAILRKSGLEEI
jgi:RNA polymerase sigma-70 factor (ECF subfamily)